MAVRSPPARFVHARPSSAAVLRRDIGRSRTRRAPPSFRVPRSPEDPSYEISGSPFRLQPPSAHAGPSFQPVDNARRIFHGKCRQARLVGCMPRTALMQVGFFKPCYQPLVKRCVQEMKRVRVRQREVNRYMVRREFNYLGEAERMSYSLKCCRGM